MRHIFVQETFLKLNFGTTIHKHKLIFAKLFCFCFVVSKCGTDHFLDLLNVENLFAQSGIPAVLAQSKE